MDKMLGKWVVVYHKSGFVQVMRVDKFITNGEGEEAFQGVNQAGEERIVIKSTVKKMEWVIVSPEKSFEIEGVL